MLIGAITVLVVVVAVFLAYNANNGLPFVPSEKVSVVLPDADRLVRGNEVRIGGQRVGVVEQLTPRVDARGRVTALATLKLEPQAAAIGRDARVRVRARSPLGLKYLEIVPGREATHVSSLDRQKQARPVELDGVLNTFDAPTRRATSDLVGVLGTGFASRSDELNNALGAFPDALGALGRVTRALAAPSTDLDGLIVGLGQTVATFGPVGDNLRRTFAHGDRTLAAIAREEAALGAIVDELPATERIATDAFASATPTLRRTAKLLRAVRPATPLLRATARDLASTAEAAPRDFRATVPLADQLSARLRGLRSLARRPSTLGSIRRLTDAVAVVRGFLPDITPFQTQCNYLGLWFRNVNSATGEGDRNGHWFRFGTIANVEEQVQRSTPASTLHSNPYPNMVAGDCEAGNEPYLPGRQIGNIPGQQGGTELTSRPAGIGR